MLGRAGALRKSVIVLSTLALAAVAVPGARGILNVTPPPAKVCTTLLGCGDDLKWAKELERKIADNMWDGQVYEVDYNPELEKTRANIVSVNHFGDSALWTGTYLAAESYRYALAKHYLSLPTTTPSERDFWTAHQAEAKSRVDQMVAKYRILINISDYWQHELQPSLEQAGFGGGVFDGEPGYLMRSCIPADTPEAYRWSNAELGPDPTGMPPPYTNHRRVFGPFDWENDDGSITTYFCEDGTSRDAYAGATFGLLTAFDLVSVDDPAMRTRIRDDFITLTNFAHKYMWNTPRPHGRISIPFGSNWQSSPCKEINAVARICGHDFENFFSPLFIITPAARLNLALGAWHVARMAPGRDDNAKWEAIWLEELAASGPFLHTQMEVDAIQPYESYYKHNLSHLIAHNITTRAPDPASKAVFHQGVGVMDKTTGDDINAHFETITYGLTGELSRRDAAIAHLRQWTSYRDKNDKGTPTNNEQYCGVRFECVLQDQAELKLDTGERVVVYPGTPGARRRARDPLPVADRAPTDFLWQRAPTQLNGAESKHHQVPGIDYLLPYWMLRYSTEVAVPGLAPFPVWPLPAHA